ncbi:hypothetical protein PHYBLDRAFT_165507 [Phycomyces blakesleeanus NRRL 1555(-)]|uniref:Uncharacterized protein n=1 Tax=Phycomyces blakesleeanus (strain ATCC 8743b / DSM 1359 / FGSC 10004 / NBRC 33097 / NRRL 1555) TaxID=763407 RepID=A0A163E6R2_PHYB8|nr:hypothetical protein PHYBLDRAFT_165507 [Phycomyces blakesleeanus NRRL 1555(-)]OAD77010.1 hypothetical protein PHYBLDRAFT_165507 [Phycomyces blakesleeanus NRRL 1555(-)]|eukprot:XP_018295050.1 hypothetical protein PHYBLDRAFT_165507 [Phycomyces blakesleeanus NRRL 1555(-)]
MHFENSQELILSQVLETAPQKDVSTRQEQESKQLPNFWSWIPLPTNASLCKRQREMKISTQSSLRSVLPVCMKSNGRQTMNLVKSSLPFKLERAALWCVNIWSGFMFYDHTPHF